ncbi:MAG: STAS domain-containing protein [Betaproteobacteria bacterium]
MIEQSADGSLRVSGPMLNANAAALLVSGRGFLRPAAKASEIVFDLSAVQETDSSALAVIFGWLRAARELGVTLRITQPSSSMTSLAALYGVSDLLPLV